MLPFRQSGGSDMDLKMLILIAFVLCSVGPLSSLPVQGHAGAKEGDPSKVSLPHSLWKRFIDTSSSFGGFGNNAIGKMRARRSAEEQCEQLELCRLHARSGSSFLAAFQLYFVNKENARLWDHRARSPQDCERRFNCDR